MHIYALKSCARMYIATLIYDNAIDHIQFGTRRILSVKLLMFTLCGTASQIVPLNIFSMGFCCKLLGSLYR